MRPSFKLPGSPASVRCRCRQGIPGIAQVIEKFGLKPGVELTISKKNRDGTIDLNVAGKGILYQQRDGGCSAGKAGIQREGKRETGRDTAHQVDQWTICNHTLLRGWAQLIGRCLSLGFTPGSVVKMMENFNSGPVLVKVHDMEVALGRGLAEKITVCPNEKI